LTSPLKEGMGHRNVDLLSRVPFPVVTSNHVYGWITRSNNRQRQFLEFTKLGKIKYTKLGKIK
jgi:hypothetical protein